MVLHHFPSCYFCAPARTRTATFARGWETQINGIWLQRWNLGSLCLHGSKMMIWSGASSASSTVLQGRVRWKSEISSLRLFLAISHTMNLRRAEGARLEINLNHLGAFNAHWNHEQVAVSMLYFLISCCIFRLHEKYNMLRRDSSLELYAWPRIALVEMFI